MPRMATDKMTGMGAAWLQAQGSALEARGALMRIKAQSRGIREIRGVLASIRVFGCGYAALSPPHGAVS